MKFIDTPIEHYDDIDVKREDLCLSTEKDELAMPSLAKLRGAEVYLRKLKENEVYHIGVFDTRVSKAGWGVAGLCNKIGLQCHAYFPLLKGKQIAHQQVMAGAWKARLIALKGGRTAILYRQAKKDLEKLSQSFMLPLGLVCTETVLEVAKISAKLPKYGTIVVSTGTGTIAAGILAGLTKENMPDKVIGISCGMNLTKQRKRICDLLAEVGKGKNESILSLMMADRGYYEPDNIETPFPAHPYYDKKAWRWLLEHKKLLIKPVLFWNIGA